MKYFRIFIFCLFALQSCSNELFSAVDAPFSTTGNYLGIYNGRDYTPIFIKGINIGAAVPGSWPGQLAISSAQYARWFRMIAHAGFNTVYIYTLHQPRFYKELARYNIENPSKPLYLLQGVWLREEYPSRNTHNDLYALSEVFDSEIQNVIDCVNGNNSIPFRFGEGFGEYVTNVSQWVIGYIIGREIRAQEIENTNVRHFHRTTYTGRHLSIEDASPSEVWITERLDRLIAHETSKYRVSRPVASSSWPTLDPLDHPSEPEGSGHDDNSVDMKKLKLVDAPGGFFLAYHVYPYYPNFMNTEVRYQTTRDEDGINNFLVYLQRLKSHYTNFPLLITEFGVSTSLLVASSSISGMNHGGMTEEEQGRYAMRMLKNIYDTNCGGGAMFSWQDEWFKTTWITHPMTSGRRNLWHNICSPENNFGLIRFAPNPNFYSSRQTQRIASGKVSRTEIWHDFATFNIDIGLRSRLGTGDTLWIAIDTYLRDRGESLLPNKRRINNRAEFLLGITSQSATLYVTEAYDLSGLAIRLNESRAYQTTVSDRAAWRIYRWRYNSRNSPHTQNIGNLNVWTGALPPKTHHLVHIKDDKISIKLPWTLLHFSDPSDSAVIDDNTSQNLCASQIACGMQYLSSSPTNGIVLTLLINNDLTALSPYSWNSWELNDDEVIDPRMFIEVEKESLRIIREGLRNTSFAAPRQ